MPRERRSRNPSRNRERNLQGFANFLQHLQRVLAVFSTTEEIESWTTTVLCETKQRLLDAYGTLTLLLNEVALGQENATGLQSNTIQSPLEDLKQAISQLITFSSTLLEKRDDIDFAEEDVSVAYSAPTSLGAQGSGRKCLEISKEQLEHLRSLYFSWENIASLLGVSISTLQRRRKQYGLSKRFESFSDITDDELDNIYREVAISGEGPTPNLGRRRFIGALRCRGLRVQRWRVSECLRRVDPVGTALRWRMVIHRRKYYVPMPNSLWHIDSCHKLIKYKLIIHVCLDGKTRVIMYAGCYNNNKAETVMALFENAVQEWGLPSRVRSDHGMENYLIGVYMIQNRGENRGSIITGSSVHNCRVERLHRDVYSGVLVFYARIFEELEYEGHLDVLDEVHLFSLHHVYIPRIQKSFNEFVNQMNNRPVSTERNQSPLQMWERGMLENILSEETPLTEGEIDEYGIDPESILNIEDEDYQVNVIPPMLENVTEETLAHLPDPMENDRFNGKILFQECVTLLKNSL